MSSIVVTFDKAKLIKQLEALPDKGREALAPWLKLGARNLVSSSGKYKGMVQATPPFQLGASGKDANASTAKQHGENKVAAQIWKVYGTPRKAFELIQAKKGIGVARRFWGYVQSNDIAKAGDMVRQILDRPLTAFDDGAEHKKRRVNGQVKGREPTFFTTKKEWIQAYAKEKQKLVGLLASLLVAEGNSKLGPLVKVPAFVLRNSLPGASINRLTNGDG